MDIKAEKIELARLILSLESEEVIRRVKGALVQESADWWDELPDNVKQDILTAEKEIEEGKGVPHHEVLNRYAHRIKRQA